ncbi:hypothetical protein AAFF_G00201480 [Aldrovandia affinis]|uniref:Uncharacterized protein n=1 Tax=Aldrovandia affinis TaxID=143900 RepID=A0AAD7SXW4_9TELE|nr:hypothetical protein AAFF_G00201480 [Aldrovandia affinis]
MYFLHFERCGPFPKHSLYGSALWIVDEAAVLPQHTLDGPQRTPHIITSSALKWQRDAVALICVIHFHKHGAVTGLPDYFSRLSVRSIPPNATDGKHLY